MRRAMVASALVCVTFLTGAAKGCEPSGSGPTYFADGAVTVHSNMRGIWNAPGGTRCRWWIQTNKGRILHNGNTTGPATRRTQKPNRAADQSQTVILGTGHVGGIFKSDKCGGWRRSK